MSTIAACTRGERGLQALAERYGSAGLLKAMDELLDYTEDMTRAELAALPDGTWHFVDFLDDDGFSETPIPIRAQLTKRAAIRWRSTSPAARRRSRVRSTCRSR